jgi:hypothetical protein
MMPPPFRTSRSARTLLLARDEAPVSRPLHEGDLTEGRGADARGWTRWPKWKEGLENRRVVGRGSTTLSGNAVTGYLSLETSQPLFPPVVVVTPRTEQARSVPKNRGPRMP